MQADHAAAQADTAQADTAPIALPLRDDTMLGVCAGLGEEFGFNPNFLRVGIGVVVLFDIVLAAGIYLGLGLALAAGRLLFPSTRHSAATALADKPIEQANDSAPAPETLAA